MSAGLHNGGGARETVGVAERTSLTELLNDRDAEREVRVRRAHMTPADRVDETKQVALFLHLRNPQLSDRARARAEWALNRVQTRVARRARRVRHHAARSRVANVVGKRFVPRSRERSDPGSRRQRARPDQGDDGPPRARSSSSRRCRSRGRCDRGRS